MATAFDTGGGSKRRRMDEKGEQGIGDTEVAAAAEEEEDRISALPEGLRLHILGLLPFKSAIRTGALSNQWRALWTHRWPAPSSLDLRLDTHAPAPAILDSLERRGRRRLDRLSLSFQIDNAALHPDGLHRILDYAAACSVADLHVDNAHHAFAFLIKLRLPRGDPHLTRLALGGIRLGLSKPFSASSHTFSVLEVISLHGVKLSDYTVENLVAASPLLRTLELCYCDGLYFVSVESAGAQLRSLTIAECKWVKDVSTMEQASSLRSFRYSGSYIRALTIPATWALADLYICFGGPAGRGRDRPSTPMSLGFAWPAEVPRNWLQALTNLSSTLTVLTLCSSALRRVSAKARARSIAGNAASCKLQNLREVQLLMFATYNENMDDIMAFLMICCSPRLERLFLQLPTRSNQYKANEEPSESEEDGSEEELSEVEASEDDLSKGEESEEDQSGQDESEEDASEEDHPKEDYSEEQVSEDSQEDESEEDQSQDDESEEDHSQEDESEEHHSQEDESEEEESEKDHEDESVEEPLGDGCENLMLLKMTNFMGRHNEMQLVSFVLKKSACLNQLILFTPERVHPGGPQTDHLSTSNYLETKLLSLEKASPNVQIILSKPDVAATRPLHSETFVKV